MARKLYYSKVFTDGEVLPAAQSAAQQGLFTDQDELQLDAEKRARFLLQGFATWVSGLAGSIVGATVTFASGEAFSGDGYVLESLATLAFTGSDASGTWYLYYDSSANAMAKTQDESSIANSDLLVYSVTWNGVDTLSALTNRRQGAPRGMTGVLSAVVTHDGGAEQSIGTVPAMSIIENQFSRCLETQAGAGFSLDIGDAADNAGLLPDTYISRTSPNISGNNRNQVGAYLSASGVPLQKAYSAATPIIAYVTQGSATAGKWLVTTTFRPL